MNKLRVNLILFCLLFVVILNSVNAGMFRMLLKNKELTDAALQACNKVNDTETADKMIACHSPPEEVKEFFKKCHEERRAKAGGPPSPMDGDSLKRVKHMCEKMEKAIAAAQTENEAPKDEAAPPPPPPPPPPPRGPMMDCKPSDEVLAKMKEHHDKMMSKEGQDQTAQCLKAI